MENVMQGIPKPLIERLSKQGYHFAGKYGMVKHCHWLHESLVTSGKKHCYKQEFYGIPSHRCVQFTPTPTCNLACLYCWRTQPTDIGVIWKEPANLNYDNPKELVSKVVKEHKQMLTGYLGNPKANKKMVIEAMHPVHITASLDGEPTLVGTERLNMIIEESFRMGFKTFFLVTNGTRPDVLARLDVEPSQLYVSLSAPNERVHRLVQRPLIPKSWKKIMESLSLFKSFKNPTVIRITLVKPFNMIEPENYAKIIDMAEPTYVEVKAAMNIGGFNLRLSKENSPRHLEVREFAEKIATLSSYNIIEEFQPSRVVLLSRLRKPIRFYS